MEETFAFLKWKYVIEIKILGFSIYYVLYQKERPTIKSQVEKWKINNKIKEEKITRQQGLPWGKPW